MTLVIDGTEPTPFSQPEILKSVQHPLLPESITTTKQTTESTTMNNLNLNSLVPTAPEHSPFH